jgi:hypothetical protein
MNTQGKVPEDLPTMHIRKLAAGNQSVKTKLKEEKKKKWNASEENKRRE